MEDLSFLLKLSERAASCRALAQGPCSAALSRQFEAMAREYETSVDKIVHQIKDRVQRDGRAPSIEVRRASASNRESVLPRKEALALVG